MRKKILTATIVSLAEKEAQEKDFVMKARLPEDCKKYTHSLTSTKGLLIYNFVYLVNVIAKEKTSGERKFVHLLKLMKNTYEYYSDEMIRRLLHNYLLDICRKMSIENLAKVDACLQEFSEHLLDRSYPSITKEVKDWFAFIRKSSFHNKPLLLRLYIEKNKKLFEESKRKNIDLYRLTSDWETFPDFLNEADLQWLKDKYEKPKSFSYQAKSVLMQYNVAYDHHIFCGSMDFWTILIIASFGEILAKSNLGLAQQCVDSPQTQAVDKLIKDSEAAHWMITAYMYLYLASIPARIGYSLYATHSLFQSKNPAPAQFPYWAQQRLDGFEKKRQADTALTKKV